MSEMKKCFFINKMEERSDAWELQLATPCALSFNLRDVMISLVHSSMRDGESIKVTQPIDLNGIHKGTSTERIAHIILNALAQYGPVESKSGGATRQLISHDERLTRLDRKKITEVLNLLDHGDYIERDVKPRQTYRIALTTNFAAEHFKLAMIKSFIEADASTDEAEVVTEEVELDEEARQLFEKCQHALTVLLTAAKMSERRTDTGKALFDIHEELKAEGFTKRTERFEVIRFLKELDRLGEYPDDHDPKVRWYRVKGGVLQSGPFKKAYDRQRASRPLFPVEQTAPEVPEPAAPLNANERILRLVEIATARGEEIDRLRMEKRDLEAELEQCKLTERAIEASDTLIAEAKGE